MKQRQVAQHRFGSVSTSTNRRRRGLADLLAGVSASAAALALSFAPQAARAQATQAVNGTPTVVFGADAPTRTATQDSFTVTANEALIDWAVTDQTTFLNAATTLNFNGSGAYTVLNRVASAPPLTTTLALNGRVQSSPQGKIWFYNPGGWAVGAGAVINVGSLLLTASPVTVDPFDPANPTASRFLSDSGAIRLGQASVAGATITVNSGANISSQGDSSYIALVAPRVVQAGTVNGAGSVAYVGAEAADITINNGLFDIAVTSGTTDPNGVVHTGTTTGPGSFGSTPRTQFLVAVGKNDAMTMLVSGQLGYNAASSAGFVNGRIVLSSGQGIVANNPGEMSGTADKISISGATLRNDLTGTASGGIVVTAGSASQSVRVNGTATLSAGSTVEATVSGTGSEFAVQGDLNLSAGRGQQGGSVKITLDSGGALRADSLFVSADGIGALRIDQETGSLLPGVTGVAAQGGSVTLNASDATLAISGVTQLSADARGGLGGAGAGSSQGGSVNVTTTNSVIRFGESGVSLTARGLSANDSGRGFLAGTAGSASTGGSASLDISGGMAFGTLFVDNSAVATQGSDQAPQAASTGNLSLSLSSGTFTGSNIQMNSDVRAVNGGAATGGSIDMLLANANVTLDGGISLFGRVTGDIPITPGASGSAKLTVGQGSSVALSDVSLTRAAVGTVGGKTATAGGVTLNVTGGSSLSATGRVLLSAEGQGFQTSNAAGGSGVGGMIAVLVDSSTLAAGTAISAAAAGVAGGNFGGPVSSEIGKGGSISLNLSGANASITAPTIDLSASGRPGSSEGALGGTAGTGGNITATIDGGTLSTSEFTLSATGEGGFGGYVGETSVPQAGGTGRGGKIALTMFGGTVTADEVTLDANAQGGTGASAFNNIAPAGRGGDAFGGEVAVNLNGGTLATGDLSLLAGANVPQVFNFGESIFVQYFGTGGFANGDGGVAGAGGAGQGGNVGLRIDGGTLAASGPTGEAQLSVTLGAGGFGGNGGSTNRFSSSGTEAIKGDGGVGKGGEATFEIFGGTADFFNLEVNASGAGGIAGFESRGIEARGPGPTGGSLGGDGGDGRGGTARVTIASDLASTNSNGDRRFIIVDATGRGADGSDGDVAGNGGNGFGGNATLEIDGAEAELVDPAVDASGTGGFGGRPGLSNPGGDGGAGFGGNATLSLSNGASFTITGGALIAEGTGTDGQTGSDGGGNAAPGNGGKGGDAQGGNASLRVSGGSELTMFQSEGGTLAFKVTGIAGNGGLGGSDVFFEGNRYGNGGTGGTGAGGGIVIEANDTTLDFGEATFSADGFGGNGGGRVTDDSGTGSGFSAGGDGGEGHGGSIRLTVSGQESALNFQSLDLRANGTAGDGEDGQGYDRTTFSGAPGGNAFGGSGGAIMLEAVNGGALTVRSSSSSGNPGRLSLEATGIGGLGGDGSNGATNPVTGAGGAGGNGGDSGQGNGGVISLLANGGTISSGNFTAIVNGKGQFGGFGGAGGIGIVPPGTVQPEPPAPPIPPAPNGAGGLFGGGSGGVGGSVELSALTDESGLVGGLSFGDTSFDVTGTINFFDSAFQSVGGKVSIIDRVDDSNGGVRFNSLDINASGDVTFEPASVMIESSDSPIVVDGNFTIAAAGDVNIQTFGTGGLSVGGFLQIDTQGTVEIDDDFCGGEFQCPTDPTISAGNSIFINASGGNVLLIGATTLNSDTAIQIDAGGSITGGPGSGYTTPGTLTLTAGGDIAIRNADVGSIEARAGQFLVFDPENESVETHYRSRDLELGEAGGGGRIAVANALSGVAGGDVVVTPGAEITTGRGLFLTSGDDILIGSNALLTANVNAGGEPDSVRFDAGGIESDDSPVEGNVASLILGSGATLDSGSGSLSLVGGAIDTRVGSLTGPDIFVDVRNSPSRESSQSDDNGQLSAPCLEGDICLGSVTTSGQLQVGQGDEAPVHFLGTADITADSVAIRARDLLSFGSNDQPLTISANGAIVVEAQDGDVELIGGAALSGGTVDVAAGSSLIGNGALISAGDVGITVGDSVTASSIIAAGQLTAFGQTGGETEPVFSVPGSFTVNQLQLGAAAVITAGGDIVVGDANLGGNNLDFDAGGLVSLDSTTQVGDITLSGSDAAFGTLVAGGSIDIDAANAVTGGSATAAGVLSIDGATIDANTLRSGGALSLTSSDATTIGTAISGAGLTIDTGALTFSALTSTGATDIAAASVGGGNITAGTSLAITSADAIGLGTATAGTALTLKGTTITATRLQSGQGMTLTTSGATTLGSASSGAGLTINSAALEFGSLTSTGATTITATSVSGGDIDAGGSLAINAEDAIDLGDASAGATLTLKGASISANALSSGGDAALGASSVDVGSINSGGGIAITAGSVDLGSTQSGGLTQIDAGTLSLSTANADGGLDVRVEGNATLGSATSGAQVSIVSGDLSFNSLTSAGATTIDASNVSGGDIDAGDSLAVTTGGNIAIGDARAGSTLSFDGATVVANALTSGSDTRLRADAVNVASIDSGDGIDIVADTVELGSTQSSGLTKIGAGTLVLSSANAGGGLELTVEGNATLGTATSGAQLTIVSGDLTFDSLTSDGATSIDASSVSGGDIDAGDSVAVTSGGSIDLGNAKAGTTLTLDGSTIAAQALTSGGDTLLTADSVMATSIDSGGRIDVTAGGDVSFGTTRSIGLTKVGAGTLTLSSANATGGLELTVSGSATLGSATSGAGLNIASGALKFDALTSTGATTIDATSVMGGNIVAGGSLAVTSPGAIALGDARSGTTLALTGSDIKAGAVVSGGNVSLSANSITATSIDSGARIDVATPGAAMLGSTRSTGLTKIGAGTLSLPSANATGGLELTVTNGATLGTVQSGAGVTATARDLRFTAITAAGNIGASATTIIGGDATSTAGAVALASTGATTVGQLRAGTNITVSAPSLTFAGINAARDVTLDIGTLNGTAIAAGQDLTIRSVNSLTFGTVGAGRNVSLTASNGALTITTDLDAGGSATLSADAISVRAVGGLRVNSANADNGDIAIITDGLLRVDSAQSIGDIALTSTANSLIVGTAVAGDAPVVATALNPGGTSQGTPGAGAVALAAANDITLLGTVDANTTLAATAGGLIDQRGLAVGKTVAYRSADIALGQGASLGQSNFTTGIALTNTGTPGAILGDVAGTTAGYRLDNTEFGRVHSGGDLSLAGGSSLAVGTLSASAASGTGGVANGNIGATSALALSTSGELGVSGALSLANAGGNTLRLTSNGALFVDAGSGSVRLVEGTGRGGTLAVSAGSILALTPAARAAIVGLDTRALDQRLAMSDGVTAGRTLIEAGAITLSSGGSILIQNTAPGISFDERRGFAADSLTLITRSEGSSTGGNTGGTPTSTTGLTDIVINGTVGQLTGLSALRAVQIDGSFSDFSTINGCRIVSASCGNPTVDPIRDLLEEEVEVGSTLDNSADGFGRDSLIVIEKIEPAGFETVIDEPVTGAGNDDFLVPEAGAGDEECTADDKTKCDKPPAG